MATECNEVFLGDSQLRMKTSIAILLALEIQWLHITDSSVCTMSMDDQKVNIHSGIYGHLETEQTLKGFQTPKSLIFI
jgi:hypothetical protein